MYTHIYSISFYPQIRLKGDPKVMREHQKLSESYSDSEDELTEEERSTYAIQTMYAYVRMYILNISAVCPFNRATSINVCMFLFEMLHLKPFEHLENV